MLPPSHGVGTGVPIDMGCMLPPSHGVGTGVPIDMWCMLPPSHGVGTGVPIDMWCMLPPSHGVGTGVPIAMCCMLPPSHGVGTGVATHRNECSLLLSQISHDQNMFYHAHVRNFTFSCVSLYIKCCCVVWCVTLS